MKRHLIDTRMGQVHCVTAGPTAGVPLFLLHQTPRSIDEFAEVIPLLARHRRVIAMDTPGYGASDPVPGRPTIADYASVAIEVLDAFGVDRAVFVGHHTGAVIAIELAAAYPERVEKVVLSGPVYTDEAARAELMPFFVQWQVQPDGSHFTDKWQRMSAWVSGAALTHRTTLDVFRSGEASEQGHFAVVDYPMEQRLPRVRCPALLLFHRRDPFSSPERVTPLLAAFRPAQQRTLDTTGVFVANEDPAAFAQAVLDYVG